MKKGVRLITDEMCELCEKTIYAGGLCLSHYNKRKRRVRGLPTYNYFSPEEREIFEAVPAVIDSSKNWELALLKKDLARALSVLKARELRVISLRFGLGGEERKTLAEIGKIFSCTRERVRQLEERALKTLRHPLRGF